MTLLCTRLRKGHVAKHMKSRIQVQEKIKLLFYSNIKKESEVA